MRDDARALALLERFARTATAFQVLTPGLAHWYDRSATGDRGLIAYCDTGTAWVSAGEPISAAADAVGVAGRFVDAAGAAHRRVAFFATEGILASSPRFRRVLIGEQPTWNPQRWEANLRGHRSLREQLRRARKKGVSVRRIDSAELTDPNCALRQRLDALVRRWLAFRPMAAMHFLVELEPFVHVERRRIFIAERLGEPMALLALAPVSARNGWLFEHLLRDAIAPNGTAELLVDGAMRELASEQVGWATLGLAPLAGDVAGWLRVARTLARPFFNFTGLSAFKRKLRPDEWEPIYLAFPRERSSIWAMRDGLSAFAGTSLLLFALRSALRGPTPLLRLLERALVPWTLILTLATVHPWFPSRLVQVAWVVFDVALLLSLRALRRRWSTILATGIAAGISVDAVLTLVQALVWNRLHIDGVMAACVVSAACMGPIVSALVMWGAVRRMRSAPRAQRPHRT